MVQNRLSFHSTCERGHHPKVACVIRSRASPALLTWDAYHPSLCCPHDSDRAILPKGSHVPFKPTTTMSYGCLWFDVQPTASDRGPGPIPDVRTPVVCRGSHQYSGSHSRGVSLEALSRDSQWTVRPFAAGGAASRDNNHGNAMLHRYLLSQRTWARLTDPAIRISFRICCCSGHLYLCTSPCKGRTIGKGWS